MSKFFQVELRSNLLSKIIAVTCILGTGHELRGGGGGHVKFYPYEKCGGRGGGHVKFYPYEKCGGGGGKKLGHAEGGGHKKLLGDFYAVA